eukprot:TRINITY_DN6679_c0_g1_i2.p1 TRINITY_DN6679_c0_g1~~TRINITY_DN6679_c0_g1_i2.p1  ORF type:complete len:203 (+),score=37.23 TRINITY_DN6679_c0_g1_i2:68-676(+)
MCIRDRFGSRKVHIKILHGRIVCRVGGGYLLIEEFIQLYSNQELAKLKKAGIDPSNLNSSLQLPTDVSDNESRSPSPGRRSPRKLDDSPTFTKTAYARYNLRTSEKIIDEDELDNYQEELQDGVVVEVSPDSKQKGFANYFRRMSRFDKPVEANQFEKVRITAHTSQLRKSSKSPIRASSSSNQGSTKNSSPLRASQRTNKD